MSWQQKTAIAALPVLAVTMFAVYQLAGARFGAETGWRLGFVPYWLIWCLALPVGLIGWRRLLASFGPARMTPLLWLAAALPPFLALAGRIVGGHGHAEPLIYAGMTLVNGTLEEVLWRGLFLALFPQDLVFGLLWPSLWFALWHFAPGGILPGTSAPMLALGALPLGLAYGYVAQKSGSIRWAVVSHVTAGLVLI